MKQGCPGWIERKELPEIRGSFRFDAAELRQALASVMNYRPPLRDELMTFWSGRRWAQAMSEAYAENHLTFDAAKRVWGMVTGPLAGDGARALGELADQVSEQLRGDGVESGAAPAAGVKPLRTWLESWSDGTLGVAMPMHPLVETAIATRVLAAGWGAIVAETVTPFALGMRVMNNPEWARTAPALTGSVLSEAGSPSEWARELPENWMAWSRACAAAWSGSLHQASATFSQWVQQSDVLRTQLTDSRMQAGPARQLADTLCSLQGRQFDIGRLADEAMVHFQTATQAVETWMASGVLQNINPERQRNRVFTATPQWAAVFAGRAPVPIREEMPPIVTPRESRQLEKDAKSATRRR